MDKFEDIRKRLKELPREMPKILKKSFEQNDSIVEDMVISQLEDGKRGDGSTLPDYSPVSVEVFGKEPGPMTLKDEGDFHRGITMTAAKDAVTIEGEDPKTEMLEFRYGEAIIKLSEESKKKLKNGYIGPEIENELKRYFK